MASRSLRACKHGHIEVELHTLSKTIPILLVGYRHTTIISITAQRFANKIFKELLLYTLILIICQLK